MQPCDIYGGFLGSQPKGFVPAPLEMDERGDSSLQGGEPRRGMSGRPPGPWVLAMGGFVAGPAEAPLRPGPPAAVGAAGGRARPAQPVPPGMSAERARELDRLIAMCS